MIVDDELLNRTAMRNILQYNCKLDQSTEIHEAGDGEEAIRLIKNDVEQNGRCTYGLVLTDLSMPVVDGYQASTAIRQHLLDRGLTQPLICAVTGHTEELYVNKAYKYGVNLVISKPVEHQLLTRLIEKTGCFKL